VKRIGLLGGMSWQSSIEYERTINEAVEARHRIDDR
jgi:aspartate/glutamate racemase